MNKEQLKSFIHGSAVSMVGLIVIGITNYLIRRILAMNLSQIDYGFFYSAFSLIGIFLTISDLGIGQTTTVLIAKYLSRNEYHNVRNTYSIIFIIKIILSFVFCISLFASTDFLVTNYFKYPSVKPVFLLSISLIPVISLEGLVRTTLTGMQNFLIQKVLIILKTICIYCLLLTVISYSSLSLYTATLIFICISLFSTIIGVLYIRFKYKLSLIYGNIFSSNNLNEIISYSKWIAISVAGLAIMNYIDTTMLTVLTNLKNVAIYNIALPITQIIQTMFIFSTVFTPIATQLWHTKKYKNLYTITQGATFCLIAVGLPIISILFFFNGHIISIMFPGKKYALQASFPLLILTAGIPIFAVAKFYIHTLSAMEKLTNVAKVVILGIGSNIILNWVLIPWLGISGAAAATVCSYCIIAIYAANNFYNELNILSNNRYSISYLLAIDIAIIITLLLLPYPHSIVLKSIYTVVTILIYILIISVFYRNQILNIISIVYKKKIRS